MSGLQKESRTDPVAGSSSMIEPSMMVQSEGYFNTVQPTAAWTGTSACSQLCRMCATENEYLIPIFEGEGVEHQLGMKIDKHLPIRVHVGDTLPLHVCYQCASTLIAWHDLVVGCIEAEKKLLQIQTHGRAEAQVEEVDVKSADSALFFPEQMDTGGAEPSTSGATNVPTRGSPKKTVPKANPKLKMVIVKTPTAPAAASSRVVAPKTEAIPDTAERSRRNLRARRGSARLKPNPSHSTLISLRRRLKRLSHRRATHRCSECSRSFADRSVATTHRLAHTPRRPFRCARCGAAFRLSASLRLHARFRCAESRPSWTCVDCGADFAHRSSLRDHANAHAGRPRLRFPCAACSQRFRLATELRAHVIDCAARPARRACDACARSFATAHEERAHAVVHSDARPHACAECGARYKRQSHLSRHEAGHRAGKTVRTYRPRAAQSEAIPSPRRGKAASACAKCGRRFASASGLTRHCATVHDKLRRFRCHACDATFTAKATLAAHARIHTGARPFVCAADDCARAFRTAQQLRSHKAAHGSARPHVCARCGRAFKRRTHLVVHERTHSGVKPFACAACSRGFAQKCVMVAHARKCGAMKL